MTDLKKIFSGKKVLVTGHTGFKGSWLSIWLKELGAKVTGYSLIPPTHPNNFEATSLKNKIKHIIGDIRDYAKVKKTICESKPEIIFHLAAQPLVLYSYENPLFTYETNITGTVNVLESARKTTSLKAIVVVTSDKCYENKGKKEGYSENDVLGGYDPYSCSKACAELITRSYIKSFYGKSNDTGIATARAGNVIGGGDWGTNRIFPDSIKALIKNKEIPVRNPNHIRLRQFVLEPLYGYLVLASKLIENPNKYTGAWNFGPNKSSCISVKEIVEKIIYYWGKGKRKNISKGKVESEMNYLTLNPGKSNNLLKWCVIYNIDEAVRHSVEWYRKFYLKKENMYNFCVNQINYYTECLSEK